MNPAMQIVAGFHRAVTRFRKSTPMVVSTQFTQDLDSLASLKDEIKAIQREHGAKGTLRNMSRLQSFVEAMTQFGQVIEVFVNANDFVCFIWGPMKFLLGIAKTHLETFDKLLDVYAQIGDAIPGHLFYRDTFENHPALKVVLQDYYSDVLKFHQEAIEVLYRPKRKQLFHATWKTFDSRFGAIMQSLKRRRELFQSETVAASLGDIDIIRKDINNMYQKNIKASEEQAQEKHETRMSLIKSRLRATDYFLDQEAAFQRREGSSTGQWLFKEPAYASWASTSTANHSCLYINGIPGAGKTTLVSLAISRLLELHTYKPSTLKHSVAYFYFKHGNAEKNSHESLLRAILTQLINQDKTVSPEFLEELSSRDDVNIRSRESLENLTERALEEYRVSFLVLDGLDECDHVQAERTVRWLLCLLDDNRYAGKTTLRLLFSGQRNGVLDKLLGSFPAICLETSHHVADIATYCLQYSIKFREKFKIDHHLEAKIVALVVDGAKGMFLYARVVVEYLLRQVSLAKLKKAMTPDVFPRQIESAYERVVSSILETDVETEREAAQKVIGLLTAAKRDLKWREIQAFFCIDSNEGTIDPEERLQLTAKELCGSLVDLHEVNGRTSEPEKVIRIVHDTAQRYLVEKKFVDASLENARLLSFCSAYLISHPFSLQNRADAVSSNAKNAYYSLQDYAVAQWYGHLEALGGVNLADKAQMPQFLQELQKAMSSTQKFLESYATSLKIEKKADAHLSPAMILNMIPRNSQDRASLLNIEQRTSWIRREIERLHDLQDNDRIILEELYGTFPSYKCYKPACSMFSEGFTSAKERSAHINCHERPFRCNQESCFAQAFGFESQEALNKHSSNYHNDVPEILQFPGYDGHLSPMESSNDLNAAVKAGDMGRIRKCLDAGANINAVEGKHFDYRTPLWTAVDRDNFDVCKLLIERGAGLGKPASYSLFNSANTVRGKVTNTPLARACFKGNIGIVDLILKADAKKGSFSNSDIRLALMKAVTKGNLEIVQRLMSSYDFPQEERVEKCLADPLLEACRRNHPSVVEFLIQNGIEFKDGVRYIEECTSEPIVAFQGNHERQKRLELTLKTILACGSLQIASWEEFGGAACFIKPSIPLMILSYPGTNLSAADLKRVRWMAGEKAYTDVVKLADKLLVATDGEMDLPPRAIDGESSAKIAASARPIVDDMPISFDFDPSAD